MFDYNDGENWASESQHCESCGAMTFDNDKLKCAQCGNKLTSNVKESKVTEYSSGGFPTPKPQTHGTGDYKPHEDHNVQVGDMGVWCKDCGVIIHGNADFDNFDSITEGGKANELNKTQFVKDFFNLDNQGLDIHDLLDLQKNNESIAEEEAMYGFGSATGRMSPAESWNQSYLGGDVYSGARKIDPNTMETIREFQGLGWNELPSDIQELWKNMGEYMPSGEATEGGLGSGRRGHEQWMNEVTELKTNKHKIAKDNMTKSNFMKNLANDNHMCGGCMNDFLGEASGVSAGMPYEENCYNMDGDEVDCNDQSKVIKKGAKWGNEANWIDASGALDKYFDLTPTMDQDGMYQCKQCGAWLDVHNIGSSEPDVVAKHHMVTAHGMTEHHAEGETVDEKPDIGTPFEDTPSGESGDIKKLQHENSMCKNCMGKSFESLATEDSWREQDQTQYDGTPYESQAHYVDSEITGHFKPADGSNRYADTADGLWETVVCDHCGQTMPYDSAMSHMLNFHDTTTNAEQSGYTNFGGGSEDNNWTGTFMKSMDESLATEDAINPDATYDSNDDYYGMDKEDKIMKGTSKAERELTRMGADLLEESKAKEFGDPWSDQSDEFVVVDDNGQEYTTTDENEAVMKAEYEDGIVYEKNADGSRGKLFADFSHKWKLENDYYDKADMAKNPKLYESKAKEVGLTCELCGELMDYTLQSGSTTDEANYYLHLKEMHDLDDNEASKMAKFGDYAVNFSDPKLFESKANEEFLNFSGLDGLRQESSNLRDVTDRRLEIIIAEGQKFQEICGEYGGECPDSVKNEIADIIAQTQREQETRNFVNSTGFGEARATELSPEAQCPKCGSYKTQKEHKSSLGYGKRKQYVCMNCYNVFQSDYTPQQIRGFNESKATEIGGVTFPLQDNFNIRKVSEKHDTYEAECMQCGRFIQYVGVSGSEILRSHLVAEHNFTEARATEEEYDIYNQGGYSDPECMTCGRVMHNSFEQNADKAGMADAINRHYEEYHPDQLDLVDAEVRMQFAKTGESLATEGKTYTCEYCGKVGTDFVEMAKEICPDNPPAGQNSHVIPIFGDINTESKATEEIDPTVEQVWNAFQNDGMSGDEFDDWELFAEFKLTEDEIQQAWDTLN